MIFGHGLLAATGLIIWIIYLASDTDALRWVALAILLVVAILGFTMARLWRQERAAKVAAAGADRTVLPPEQHFPVALIGLHGLLAVTTLVLSCSPASELATRRPHELSRTRLSVGRHQSSWRAIEPSGMSLRPSLGWFDGDRAVEKEYNIVGWATSRKIA